MFPFRSWLKKLFSSRPAYTKPNRRLSRLLVETLEDRAVPATFLDGSVLDPVPTVIGDNQTGEDLFGPGMYDLKFDSGDIANLGIGESLQMSDAYVTITITVTAVYEDGIVELDWTLDETRTVDGMTTVGIDAAIMKAGNGALLYDYTGIFPEPDDDQGLETPVREQSQGGNIRLTPIALSHVSFCYDLEEGTHECPDPVITNDFIFVGGNISGQKWQDFNANGTQDVGDDGIENWSISLYRDYNYDLDFDDDGELLSAISTDSDGNYSFNDLAAGSYRVVEASVYGWTAMTPTFHDVTLIEDIDVNVSETFEEHGDHQCLVEVLTVTTTSVSSSGDNSFGNFKNISITGTKFYDANANGIADDTAVVAGWTIILDQDGNLETIDDQQTATTDGFGIYTFDNVGPGTYLVVEGAATSSGWIQTYGIGGYTVTAGGDGVQSGGESTDNDFGNLKLMSGTGGRTLGFWSNKNGQKVILDGGSAATELTFLNSLNLVTASGGDLCLSTNSAGVTQLEKWLLSANATNMAYMLSAQLTASVLSVEAGFLSASSIIDTGSLLVGFAGYLPSLNIVVDANNVTHGFITIGDLQAAANAALLLDSNSLSGDFWRAYQEALKTALDKLNNNLLSFVA